MKNQETKKTSKKLWVILKILLVLVIIGFLGVAALGLMNIHVYNSSSPDVYSLESFTSSSVSSDAHYDAVIVLGCAVWEGGVASPMLADRLRTAAAVFKTGCADYVLVTGDSENPEDYDETGCMKEFLINEGISESDILCDPLFTQVGIAHEVYDDENMIIMIFATEYVPEETKFEIPFGNISELKKAFDILDEEGNQILKMNEIMVTLDEMGFSKTDPTLYSIFKDLSNKDKCSWPKFWQKSPHLKKNTIIIGHI